jgi:hypothetical protein
MRSQRRWERDEHQGVEGTVCLLLLAPAVFTHPIKENPSENHPGFSRLIPGENRQKAQISTPSKKSPISANHRPVRGISNTSRQ